MLPLYSSEPAVKAMHAMTMSVLHRSARCLRFAAMLF